MNQLAQENDGVGAETAPDPAAPQSDLDLYTDETLRDPFDSYATLRALGGIVWMTRLGVWAAPRYATARAVLKDHETFTSRLGVGLDDEANEANRGGMLHATPPRHTALRRVMNEQLAPRAVEANVGASIRETASAYVERLCERGEFDAVEDLAVPLVNDVVCGYAGLPEESREQLTELSVRTFDIFGPRNDRLERALANHQEALGYGVSVAVPGRLEPGKQGMAIYQAAADGRIAQEDVVGMVLNYPLAGLDTTISAIGSAVQLFARNPDQWQRLKADPELMDSAIAEVLRLESPAQAFTRTVTKDVEIDGITMREGDKVLVMWGSANRDEDHYPDAATFDIGRGALDHLAFGHGLHTCVGMHLAKAEIKAVLTSLLAKVERFIEVDSELRLNNAARGLGSLNVQTVPS